MLNPSAKEFFPSSLLAEPSPLEPVSRENDITSNNFTIVKKKIPPRISNRTPNVDVNKRDKIQKVNRTQNLIFGGLPFSSHDLMTVRRRLKSNKKALILLRGLPGSGKSTLAHELCTGNGITLSTDEYFTRSDGSYLHDSTQLEEAHRWNFQRAASAIDNGVSPVVIDNTNIHVWEMRPYVICAAKHNYDVHFVEPQTPWKLNLKQLLRKNKHGVDYGALKRMKDSFEKANINCFGLTKHESYRPKMFSNHNNNDQASSSDLPNNNNHHVNRTKVEQVKKADNSFSALRDLLITTTKNNENTSNAPISKDNLSQHCDTDDDNEIEGVIENELQWDSDEEFWGDSEYVSTPEVTVESGSHTEHLPDSTIVKETEDAYVRSHRLSSSFSEDIPDARLDPISNDGSIRRSCSMADLRVIDTRILSDVDGLSLIENSTTPSTSKTVLSSKPKSELKRASLLPGLNNDDGPFSWKNLTKVHVENVKHVDHLTPTKINNQGYVQMFSKPTQTSDDDLIILRKVGNKMMEISVATAMMRSNDNINEKKNSTKQIMERKDHSRAVPLDKSTETDTVLSNAISDPLRTPTRILSAFFPQATLEMIDHVLSNCKNDVQWAAEVLVDTGHVNVDVLPSNLNVLLRSNSFIAASTSGAVIAPQMGPTGLSASNGGSADSTAHRSSSHSFDNDFSVFKSSNQLDLVSLPVSSALMEALENFMGSMQPDNRTGYKPPTMLVDVPVNIVLALHFYCSNALKHRVDNRETFDDEAYARMLQRHEDIQRGVLVPPPSEDTVDTSNQSFRDLLRSEEAQLKADTDFLKTKYGGKNSAATQAKKGLLYDMFPTLDKLVVCDVLVSADFNHELAISMITEQFHALPRKNNLVDDSEMNLSRSTLFSEEFDNSTFNDDECDDYESVREEAQSYYQLKVTNVQKAGQQNNDPRIAAHYMREARKYDEMYRRANQSAADLILAKRKSENAPGVLDLHGLHVTEAVSALATFITENNASLNKRGSVRVITGVGKHSDSLGPKLRPAVQNYLKSKKELKFEVANAGEFKITKRN